LTRCEAAHFRSVLDSTTDRRASFVNTVTSSRLKWIDSLRDEVAEFIATTTRLVSRRDSGLRDDKTEEMLLQREILVHQIALHLNPEDIQDQNIKKLTESISQLADSGGTSAEISASLTRLRDTTAIYLKKEWNRVKNESVGGGDSGALLLAARRSASPYAATWPASACVVQNGVVNALPRPRLRPLDRLLALVAGRHRVPQHLPYRLSRQPVFHEPARQGKKPTKS
jgi:hypothetical protein